MAEPTSVDGMSTDPPYPRVEPNPLAGVPCAYCGVADLWVELRPRITARPLGTWSLAGAQLKTSAVQTTWQYGVCGSCGHVSEGKPDKGDDDADKCVEAPTVSD